MPTDFSPLAYFRELHLVPRVIFSIGGVLFLTGGLKDWKLVVLGAGLLFVALGYNFFANLLWHDPHPPYSAHIAWPNLFQGVVTSAIGIGLLYVVGYTYHYGLPPVLLRPGGAP
jgi:hypothetical protein